MSPYSFTCPGCNSNLRSNKPVEFRVLTCPRCQHTFSVEAEEKTGIETKKMATLSAMTNHHPSDSLLHFNEPAEENLTIQYPADLPPSVPLTRRLFPMAALLSGLLLLGGGLTLFFQMVNHRNKEQAHTNPRTEDLTGEKERLAQQKKELQEEKDKLASERKQDQLRRLIADGEMALTGQQYSEAEKFFNQAVDLFPDDASAKAGLVKAKAGLMSANQLARDKEKRQAEYQRLMLAGKEKMTAKQYGAAVVAFQQALNLLVGDAAATQALDEAQKALTADASQNKKMQDYQKAMDQGRAALVGQRYQDALDAYQVALLVLPEDLEARRGIREAQARLNDQKKGMEDQTGFDREMTRGKDALRDRKYSIAIAAFERALGILPGNSDATVALKQARKMLADMKTEMSRYLQMGDMAMAAGRFEEALRNYQKAVAIMPDDPTAVASLQKAQNAFNDMGASQAAYLRFMNQGQQALRSRLYSDAVAAFSEALRIAPLDVGARNALQDAQRHLDRYLQGQVDVDRYLVKAQASMQQQQWADAVKSLNAANQINADDMRILPLLRNARYGQNMAEGQAAFLARRWADAVRKFEDALQDKPGDSLAKSRRDQAKGMIR